MGDMAIVHAVRSFCVGLGIMKLVCVLHLLHGTVKWQHIGRWMVIYFMDGWLGCMGE